MIKVYDYVLRIVKVLLFFDDHKQEDYKFCFHVNLYFLKKYFLKIIFE